MKMEVEYKLFKYQYYYHIQGTRERDVEYALLRVSKDTTFDDVKTILFDSRYKEYYHEIIMDSVEDLTIYF